MANLTQVLIIDDDEDILVAGTLLLQRHRFQVTSTDKPENIPSLLKSTHFDVVLLDMNFGPGESSGKEGLKWLSQILEINPDCIVIMITAHGGMNLAIEAMKLGATDFVIKPWQNEKLVATIKTAAELSQARNEAKQLRTTNQLLTTVANQSSQSPILGQSQALQSVMSMVAKTAPTDANILILGENGTGKELLAKEIHAQSHRRNNIFLTVDLGAISETLFESELFGHKKGAFTGANEDRIGKLEAADGGTLFFDELGNLPLHQQARLLTVLEQRKVTKLGANTSQAFDVRIICATNVDKQNLLDESIFRQDLLFRLNTVEITLPPLRERTEDIPILSQYFVDFYSKKYGKPSPKIPDNVFDAMAAYAWPGNIRALRHSIERAIILCEGNTLSVNDLQLTPPNQMAPNVSHDQHVASFQKDTNELNLEQIEKQTISKALRQYRYNISHTAKALGLTRAALYRRMEKHGL